MGCAGLPRRPVTAGSCGEKAGGCRCPPSACGARTGSPSPCFYVSKTVELMAQGPRLPPAPSQPASRSRLCIRGGQRTDFCKLCNNQRIVSISHWPEFTATAPNNSAFRGQAAPSLCLHGPRGPAVLPGVPGRSQSSCRPHGQKGLGITTCYKAFWCKQRVPKAFLAKPIVSSQLQVHQSVS